jgi:hypothetical protein
MNLDKLAINYVSDADKLLNKLHSDLASKSPSIQKEVNKAREISRKRDDANIKSEPSEIWGEF